jgi:thiamine-phosphate pyrophosphorylase
MTHSERMVQFARTDLYLVITESFCGGRPALEILDAALAAGVRLVQFREKDLDARTLCERALQFRSRTREADALLIINDRVDIALAVGADGVHLGQGDLPIVATRRIAPELIIGASSHNAPQAEAAQAAGASYINIGPIFATNTKVTGVDPLGPESIGAIAPSLTVPFTTMGGIKPTNIAQVLEQGARHPAVVTAVTQAEDPQQAAQALRDTIQAARKK